MKKFNWSKFLYDKVIEILLFIVVVVIDLLPAALLLFFYKMFMWYRHLLSEGWIFISVVFFVVSILFVGIIYLIHFGDDDEKPFHTLFFEWVEKMKIKYSEEIPEEDESI